jgi:hypothetical protein
MNSGPGYRLTRTASGVSLDTTEPFPQSTLSASDHPFKCVLAGSTTVSGTTTYYYSVTPGTVNNISPKLFDSTSTLVPMTGLPRPKGALAFDPSTYYSYIYLRCSPDAGDPTIYPDPDTANAEYPEIKAFSTQQTSTDTNAYILLAAAYKDPTTDAITLWQYVTGSLWTDRIKLAGIDARYFWARL